MAPTRARTLDIYERERNPSILATSQDDFDLHDDWNELDRGFGSRWRNSCPDKKTTGSSTSRWTSRLTSLSLSLTGAGTALTSRAKHLSMTDSTQQTVSRLRKAVKGASSRTEVMQRGATSAHGRPGEVDDMDDQPESESGCTDDDMYANLKVLQSPVKRVHAGRAKTLTKWIRHRSSASN
ncbi:unnamed protein product [Hyaloperonospora brassicae]|uniref:Uncharacterized protein n=1 Tax=Hyaloperonospora brassicae TaxID=162125 RepID=A0AAV0U5F6_HYABA|nr:unnamed protein product [Hyaloperonospora brassicae]